MPLNSLILIGAGGHCRSCIDVIELSGNYTIAGIVDTAEKVGQYISGHRIVGTDNDYADLVTKGHQFLVTIAGVKSTSLRKSIFDSLVSLGATFATIVSPRAYVSRTASIGRGTIIMHGVHVNAFARIADNTILNTASTIEHDATVGNHCHISTHCIVNGGAVIGSEVFAGSASVISNGIEVAAGTIIGAGTIVHKSIGEAGTYVGNPFRKIA